MSAVEVVDWLARQAQGDTIGWGWAVCSLVQCLREYPLGVTKAILLSEIDRRWRGLRKQGAASGVGTVEAVVAAGSVAETDVVRGTIAAVSSQTYELRGTEARITLILHRQYSDWLAYCHFKSVNFFAEGRRSRLTSCRVIREHRGELCVLPTELTVFELIASSENDRALLYGPLQELHSHVLQQAMHCPNDTPLGLIARVLHIGEVKSYPTAAHSRYCVVRLRPLTPTLNGDEACVVRLLLVDNQVSLASLFQEGDTLYLHRPFFALNELEPAFHNPHAQHRPSSLQFTTYTQTQWADAVFDGAQHPDDGGQQVSWHMLYGTITTILWVDSGLLNPRSSVDPVDAALSASQEILRRYGLKRSEDGVVDVSTSRTVLSAHDLRPGMINICVIAQIVAAEQIEQGLRFSIAVLAGLTDCDDVSLLVTESSLIVDRIMAGSIILLSGAHVSADGSALVCGQPDAKLTLPADRISLSPKLPLVSNFSSLLAILKSGAVFPETSLQHILERRQPACVVRAAILDVRPLHSERLVVVLADGTSSVECITDVGVLPQQGGGQEYDLHEDFLFLISPFPASITDGNLSFSDITKGEQLAIDVRHRLELKRRSGSMYSTRLINKSVVDGNKYVSIGTPYVDPNRTLPERWKKKQFQVAQSPAIFGKLTYESPGAYATATSYLSRQPLEKRKNGFGSKDAHRRDEFTNAIRTEQYRETLRKEQKILQKQRSPAHQELLQQIEEEKMSQTSTISRSPSHLYDIGRSLVTPFDPKSSRDTYYKYEAGSRNVGAFQPVSSDIGSTAWDVHYHPPEHGPKSYVKNFYDKGHISLGDSI